MGATGLIALATLCVLLVATCHTAAADADQVSACRLMQNLCSDCSKMAFDDDVTTVAKKEQEISPQPAISSDDADGSWRLQQRPSNGFVMRQRQNSVPKTQPLSITNMPRIIKRSVSVGDNDDDSRRFDDRFTSDESNFMSAGHDWETPKRLSRTTKMDNMADGSSEFDFIHHIRPSDFSSQDAMQAALTTPVANEANEGIPFEFRLQPGKNRRVIVVRKGYGNKEDLRRRMLTCLANGAGNKCSRHYLLSTRGYRI